MQRTIGNWSRRIFPNQTPERIARHIREESGELVDYAAGEPDRLAIANELADVVILAATMADNLGISLAAAVQVKHAFNAQSEFRPSGLAYDKRVTAPIDVEAFRTCMAGEGGYAVEAFAENPAPFVAARVSDDEDVDFETAFSMVNWTAVPPCTGGANHWWNQTRYRPGVGHYRVCRACYAVNYGSGPENAPGTQENGPVSDETRIVYGSDLSEIRNELGALFAFVREHFQEANSNIAMLVENSHKIREGVQVLRGRSMVADGAKRPIESEAFTRLVNVEKSLDDAAAAADDYNTAVMERLNVLESGVGTAVRDMKDALSANLDHDRDLVKTVREDIAKVSERMYNLVRSVNGFGDRQDKLSNRQKELAAEMVQIREDLATVRNESAAVYNRMGEGFRDPLSRLEKRLAALEEASGAAAKSLSEIIAVQTNVMRELISTVSEASKREADTVSGDTDEDPVFLTPGVTTCRNCGSPVLVIPGFYPPGTVVSCQVCGTVAGIIGDWRK